jgi:hypothetical protein
MRGAKFIIPFGGNPTSGSLEYIRELFGFRKGAPEKVDVPDGILDGFWNLISGEAHQQCHSIRNPIIQVFHSWMCKRIMGRMREMKVTDTELNWLYSALIAKQLLTVKIRQPSHEFTFGVDMSFIPYPLVLTPVV